MKINFPLAGFYRYQKSQYKTNNQEKTSQYQNYNNFSSNIAFRADYQCSTNSFGIKTLKNMHCPVCDKLMLTQNQVNDFINNASSATGDDLIRILEEFENEKNLIGKKGKTKSIYRKNEQEIVNIIKDLAKKYPNKNLADLVKIESIQHLRPLIQKYDKITGEASHFVRMNIDCEEKRDFILDRIHQESKRLKRAAKGNEKCAKPSTYRISSLIPNRKLRLDFYEILSKLPNSINDCDCFFVKYSKPANNDSKQIAQALVNGHIPTAEHINPYGAGGGNTLKNYICDCVYCNNERDFMPFDIWCKTVPNFESNLNNYLINVQNAVEQGKLDKKYSEYIDEVIGQIRKLSYGKLKLQNPKSV